MEPLISYLLKSSGVLLLFLGCYQLLLRRETLFHSNRWFLLIGIGTALFLPFAYYTKITYLSGNMPVVGAEGLSNTTAFSPSGFTWTSALLYGYLLGTLFFALKLFLELRAVFKSIKNGKAKATDGHVHVRTTEDIRPFSFFKFILYNPKNHTPDDLELILAHEQVHAGQWHSMDILLMEIMLLIQWFNPIAWLYRQAIKENLEFLADTENTALRNHKKQYQYLLLRQSVDTRHLSIINPFFNSLIKKRIVMINQIPSQKVNAIKTLIIVPLLALFFVSFNGKTEYRIEHAPNITPLGKTIELVIDKDTSEEELADMKNDLKKDGVDFSYTIKHNSQKEIVDIAIQISGKGENGATFNNSYNSSNTERAISPLYILIDAEHNLVSIGTKGTYRSNSVHIDADDDRIWINSDHDKHREIRISEKDGEKIIIVDGKEISEEEFERLDIHTGGSSSKVFIHTDSDDEHDIRVIGDEGNSFFFIDTDGDKEPIFLVDGKRSTSKKVKRLDPDDIESIDVSKGEKALERFGEEGKNGVVEITTKKN